MLTISNLSKSYGVQELFRDASLIVSRGERLGLVGRNGHGKSTLLRLILEEEGFDSGEIQVESGCRVGHLEQHLNFAHETVHEEVCQALPVLAEGYREEYKAEKILSGLGFSEEEFFHAPDTFSGGFQIRIQLAKLLVSEPDLLLLDEPTNYLDIVSIRWLEEFLVQSKTTLILITHDRRFMDRVVTHTAIIHRSRLRKIPGNTSRIYDQIAEEEEIYLRTVQNQQKQREDTLRFIERFRYKASKAKQVQSRVKALEREGTLEELSQIDSLDFSFPVAKFQGKRILKVEEITFGYPTTGNLFEEIGLSLAPGDRVAVIGPNGKGKTTLLEVLARELEPGAGNVSYHADCRLGYYGQTNINRLDLNKTVEQEILGAMDEQHRSRARAICGTMMFSGDLALKKNKVLSGGERARVLLGKLLAQPTNLLLLDEPSNHLDMYSVEAMIEAIELYPGGVIFVTHDEEIIDRLADRLIVFDGGRVMVWEGSYQDFLSRHGWSGEERTTNSESSSSAIGKKELRRLRAQITKEFSAELKPIEKKIKQLEKRIMDQEKSLAEAQEELLEITKTGYGDEAVKLTRQIAEYKENIDSAFEDLEQLETDANEKRAEIEKRVQAIQGGTGE